MVGTYVLAGGDEFQSLYDELDRSLLAMLPTGARQIIIIPTEEAADASELAIASGVHHFQSLAPRARVEGAIVVDAHAANDSALAGRIASASLVYLSGEHPTTLVHALRGSEVLAAIAAVAARGGIVAGSNAGAMALCAVTRLGNGWQPALGLVEGVAVLSHHDGEPLPITLVRAGLPREITVIGIPTGVNCVAVADPSSDEPTQWRVAGNCPVTLYGADGVHSIAAGESFTLEVDAALATR